nr:hypothetical protein [Butyrivibrio sp.]
MNKDNLRQIFDNYIKRFDEFDQKYTETYKWKICRKYPELMHDALNSEPDEFADKLKAVKYCTYNIIDSYTQPFGGLVDFAREDPVSVQNMFKNLYEEDNGDLKIRMEKISDFFTKSGELLERFTPGSYLFAQNSHSVSSYLFLNDPDNHYMYKATQSQRFADCVEFLDDWGT